MKVATYVRVSTFDQHTANQLPELVRYAQARKWTITAQYEDQGVSGSQERRPGLDRLLKDARARRFDTLLVWRIDRLGRSLRHLLNLLHELRGLGIDFIALDQQIDTTTSAGRLQLHMLSAFAEFERAQIQERVRAGLARVRANGTLLGRPRDAALEKLDTAKGLSHSQAAKQLGVSIRTVIRWRQEKKALMTKTPMR